MDLSKYSNSFLSFLKAQTTFKEPSHLYDPVDYILSLGGKRIRPLLTLMSVDAFGKDYQLGLHAALAVEVFHNFTLLHDDIMDDAPLRRGKATVHEKWDVNTAILSGDAMMILANQYLEAYDGETYKRLMHLFQKTALEVCEGQQYDMDFETRGDVSIPEYMEMIRLKTSVLVAAALKMGAIIANATEADAEGMYQYGLSLGLAFQLQDDYLDAFGDPETFGKQVGGDIIENKKTFLFLKAYQNLEGAEQAQLLELFTHQQVDLDFKIEKAKELFVKSMAVKEIQQEIKNYTQHAFEVLDHVAISSKTKEKLIGFGNYLMSRKV